MHEFLTLAAGLTVAATVTGLLFAALVRFALAVDRRRVPAPARRTTPDRREERSTG